MEFEDWNSVEAAVTELASSHSFDPGTVANMHDLIAACRALCPVPEGIAKGYWSTFAIWWRNIQIEIFEDRYEYYRFKQGSSDIEYFAHTPGTAMPEELMKRLPA